MNVVTDRRREKSPTRADNRTGADLKVGATPAVMAGASTASLSRLPPQTSKSVAPTFRSAVHPRVVA